MKFNTLLSIVLLSVIAFSCNDRQRQAEQTLSAALASIETPPATVTNHTAPKEKEGIVYRLSDRQFTRILTVWRNSATEIKFKIAVMDADGECELDMTGIAKSRGGDGEIRETDTGESLPADQYDFEGEGCGISILLEMNSGDNAWVEQWDCPKHEGDCNFASVINLPRVD